jgi:TolB-like protein/Tfp pilus assembly protein PilF
MCVTVVAGTRLDHYAILSPLGEGGMGEVYLAQDTRLPRKVALKLLPQHLTSNEERLRRFQQEAQAASALNHPNILTIYEVGEFDGVHFMAAEYVEGETLRDRLRSATLDLSAALDIGVQLASALIAAHSAGIVHRDIKPANVIVRPDGIVKILDFGLAKLNDQTDPAAATVSSWNTIPGTVMGTASYMSPEQARGQPVDARSDIFSLGVMLYEMLAGRPPFVGATTSDLIAAILMTEPPAIGEFAPGLPPEIEPILHQALAKDLGGRYQAAQEMLADLKDVKEELEFQKKLERKTDPSGGQPAYGTTGAELQPQGRASGRGSGAAKPVSGAGMQTPGAHRGSAGAYRPGKTTLLLQSRRDRRRMIVMLLAGALVAGAAVGVWFYIERAAKTGPVESPTIAILPFRNLKPDTDSDFLGFSLADAITAKLGYVSALTVRPSSYVYKYRNQTVDPQLAARELNVNTLLTGTFLKERDNLHISAQLIDVKAGKLLWNETLDLQYDKLLTVQDRVAQEVVRGMELSLTPAEAARLQPGRSVNPQAYEYYLRGVDFYSMNDFPMAIKMLERAAALQPDYEPIWAHLGRSYTTNASLRFGGRDEYKKAQEAYQRALTIDPSDIQARIFMANLFTDTGRVEQAVPLVRAVLEASPNNAEAHWELGYAYRFGGMLNESVAECERARQLDPQVKITSSALNAYLYLGQYDQFLLSLPQTDNSVFVLFYRGFGEYYQKNWVEAAANFDRAYAMDSSALSAQLAKAFSDAIAHDNPAGLELLRQTENRIQQSGVSDAEGIYKIAQAYAAVGDKRSAIRMLRESIDGGFFPSPYFETDPLLDPIRKEPEFAGLLDQARRRHEDFKSKFFPADSADAHQERQP